MRTTIAIDDDVLQAAKALAEQRHCSLGQVISDLARRSHDRPQAVAERNGVPLLKTSAKTRPVTLEVINALHQIGKS